MASNHTLQILEQVDSKLDEVEALLQTLPLNPAVRAQLVNKVYDLWTEIEETVDLAPTDW